MVSQKMISFKIDEDLLPMLDMLCDEFGSKRNRMLNCLVRIGVTNLSGSFKPCNLTVVYQDALGELGLLK